MQYDQYDPIIQRHLEVTTQARQTLARVNAKLARSRAEATLHRIEEQQRRDATRRIFKARLDLRPNHFTDSERAKAAAKLRRWHEVKARAYRILGRRPQQDDNLIYRAAVDELSNNTDGFDFILSDATPDRFDDVIDPTAGSSTVSCATR